MKQSIEESLQLQELKHGARYMEYCISLGWRQTDSSNTSHEMGIIDVWIFDIVEIYDVVLVTHLSIIKIVTTHAF